MDETRIYTISQTIYSDRINTIIGYHNNMVSNRVPFAGLCVAPKKDSFGNTIGLVFIAVGYQPENTGAVERLVMVTHPELMDRAEASSRLAAPAAVTPPDRSIFEITFSSLNEVSLWSRIFDYDRTREFDYAFIDAAVLDYMTTEEGFYTAGTDLSIRGIQIERALTVFSTERERSLSNFFSDNESGVYRSLKVTPFPTPNLASGYSSRSSTAYAVIPTCPPFWRGSTGATTSTMQMARSIVDTQAVSSSLTDACTCAFFSINRQQLVQKLIEIKVVPAQEYPLYIIKKWPFILLTLLITVLSVLGSREIYGLVSGK
jgi:hypothetical protein